MAGSTFGKIFCVTNFGESHGPAVGCVVDGCPAGMELSAEDIQVELDRRKPGTSRHVTQRRESDAVEILSGVYKGVTTGTPIALLIRNQDQKSKDYSDIENLFRPAHADWTYLAKYGVRDPRGGGRSSARLTAPTVAAGAVAKKWLREKYGVEIRGCLVNLGGKQLPVEDWNAVSENPFFCAAPELVPELEEIMDQTRRAGDSIGAEVLIEASGVPAGWGAPIYDKLDAEIAYAFMGLNAVKGVEIGEGFNAVSLKGSENCDEMRPGDGSGRFATNHAGGVLGGISSGQTVSVRAAIKPTPSIRLEKRTVNIEGEPVTVSTKGRHDPCVGIRAVPVLESLLALVLIDAALLHQAYR